MKMEQDRYGIMAQMVMWKRIMTLVIILNWEIPMRMIGIGKKIHRGDCRGH